VKAGRAKPRLAILANCPCVVLLFGWKVSPLKPVITPRQAMICYLHFYNHERLHPALHYYISAGSILGAASN